MTPALASWLAFALAAGVLSWFSPRATVPFVGIVIAMFFAAQLPLGHPSLRLPDGEHSVLGAKIVEDVAIYVLLDADEPRYYRLPYDESTAQQLQNATDGASESGTDVVINNEDGAIGIREDVPPPEPPKRGETPVSGG
jgi:hypothetical protein